MAKSPDKEPILLFEDEMLKALGNINRYLKNHPKEPVKRAKIVEFPNKFPKRKRK